MECQSCGSERILSISGKVSDKFVLWLYNNNEKEYDGYVPDDLEIGGNDYIEFNYCLECGQIQGDFPVMDPNWKELCPDLYGEDE